MLRRVVLLYVCATDVKKGCSVVCAVDVEKAVLPYVCAVDVEKAVLPYVMCS